MAGLGAWELNIYNGNPSFKRKKNYPVNFMEQRKQEFKAKKKKLKMAKKSKCKNRNK